MLRVKATWGRITGWEGRFTPAPCSRKIEEKSGGKPPFPTCDPAKQIFPKQHHTHASLIILPLPNYPIVNLLDLVDDLLPAEAGIYIALTLHRQPFAKRRV